MSMGEMEQPVEQATARVSRWAAFAMGAAAGAIMTALLLAMRLILDSPVIAEVMADWITVLLPPVAFDYFLERLQSVAKPLLYATILAGQVAVGGGVGVLYVRRTPPAPPAPSQRLLRSLVWTGGIWLILAGVVTPIMGVGVAGTSVAGGGLRYSLVLLVGVAAYVLSLIQFLHAASTRDKFGQERGRREFIRRAAIFSVLVLGSGFLFRGLVSKLSLSGAANVRGELSSEVTPTDQFYSVSKNIFTPNVDVTTWRLEVDGGVGRPISLTYDELLGMTAIEEYVTLTCISNLIGGNLISNALWKGVPLKLLLERAELPPTAKRIAFHATDSYVDSFPVEYALRDNVIVAYEMNGEPLSPKHGFPARIIVPGLYGMENVKWLNKIESVPEDFRGYYQRRGWADTAVIKTMSRVDVPPGSAKLAPENHLIGGIAFAGDRGISKVEVSADDRQTWEPAEVRKPLSPYTWVIWTRSWDATDPGLHRIWVRATDGTGEVQTAEAKASLPSGATGRHHIFVVVQEPDGSPPDLPELEL